jgi:hypothetical protein
MIRLKHIKEHYSVLEVEENKYTLSKDCEFIANIEKLSIGKFRLDIDGYEPTYQIDTLLNDIKTWYDSLPYPPSCYNKYYRTEFRFNLFVSWYLNKLGYEKKYDGTGKGFSLTRKNIRDILSYQDTIHFEIDVKNNLITFYHYFLEQYSWTQFDSPMDFENIIEKIETNISLLRYDDAKWNIEQLSKISCPVKKDIYKKTLIELINKI